MFGCRRSSAKRSFAGRRGLSSRRLKCLQNGGPRGLLEQSALRGELGDVTVGVFQSEDDRQGH